MLVDVLFVFNKLENILINFRLFFLILLIVSCIFVYSKEFFNETYFIIIVLLSYLLFKLLSSSELNLSFTRYLKFFFPLILLPFSIIFSKTGLVNFKEFIYSIRFAAFIFFMNFPLSTYFGWQTLDYTYTTTFISGNLVASALYTGSVIAVFIFAVLILPSSLINSLGVKKYYFFDLALFFGVIVVLILSLRRTAILTPFLCILFLIFRSIDVRKIFLYSALFLFFFIFFIYYFSDVFLQRLETRIDRFSVESLESEGRYIETILVWSANLSFEEPSSSFFGKELFNSSGNYGFRNDRVLHVDINQILHGSGLFGLFLYFLFFLKLFTKILQKKSNRWIKPLSLSVFFIIVINSFSSGLLALTYRFVAFYILGYLIGYQKYTNEDYH